MGYEEIALPAGHRGVRLQSDQLAVTVLPEKGCDVYAVVDARTGTDILFKSPWGLQPRAGGGYAADSVGHWLRQYPGGWQLILPNGGADSTLNGAPVGFHGEACLTGWEHEPAGDAGLSAHARLFSAPLALSRRLEIDGPALQITETVTNESPDPTEFMWGHHPAFGAPFLQAGGRISVGATTYTADDEAPGTLLEPGSAHEWPLAKTVDGTIVDLSVVPGTDEPRMHLGYLTEFEQHFFAITNPDLNLGVAVQWSGHPLDHAWFWQEAHASPGYPWHRRAYVTAMEPNSTIPGQGLEAAKAKGGTPVVLDGGESATLEIEMRLFEGSGLVADINDSGIVTLDEGT